MKVLESVFIKVAVFLALCWLSGAATGGCSRYGHACWGGHGKRSSHGAKAQDIDKVVDVDLDGEDAGASETSQDADDGDAGVTQAQAQAEAMGAGQRRFPGRFGLNAFGDLVSIPSEQALQDPGVAEESDEEEHRKRPQNRRRHRNGENNLEVLIIPDGDSQLPDFHIYKILGHTPRKRV